MSLPRGKRPRLPPLLNPPRSGPGKQGCRRQVVTLVPEFIDPVLDGLTNRHHSTALRAHLPEGPKGLARVKYMANRASSFLDIDVS
jgi:hypothetical protein